MMRMFNYPINVTIDTNVFDATKYNLGDNSNLRLLVKYVQERKINLVLSDIVIREVKKHIKDQIENICAIEKRLRKEVLKKSSEHFINHIGLSRVLENTDDRQLLIDKGIELFDKFLNDTNAEILNTDLIKIEKIIDDYFELRPPFENKAEKKNEFPDAFIVSQIRNKFDSYDYVAVISNDNGFKKAFEEANNYHFYCDLRELYNAINKEEEATYQETLDVVEKLQYSIIRKIVWNIENCDDIDVRGISYDKDGVFEGFDYTDVEIHDIADASFNIHTVDELTDEISKLTLVFNANISVDCTYEDYDNAMWDSEEGEYIFVEDITIREEHNACLAVRIEVNRISGDFTVYPFNVILGGDSRKKRYRLDEYQDVNSEQEIANMYRQDVGLQSLGNYEYYLERKLPESEFYVKIIESFKKMNQLYTMYEEFSMVYDELLTALNDKDIAQNLIRNIYMLAENNESSLNYISDNIEEFKKYVNDKYEEISNIADNRAPDSICYGDSVELNGIDNTKIIISLDEIHINPSEGDEEYICVRLLNECREETNGYIILTVGSLSYDECGAVVENADDRIDYECSDIIKKLGSYLLEQKQKASKEFKEVEIIKNALKKVNIDI